MRITVAVVLAALAAQPALAKDPDGRYADSPLHAWYESQHNALGQWCCNEADGHPFYGNYKVNEDGSISVEGERIEGYKVLKGPNPTGHAVWWFTEGNGGKTTWCFMPGSMT